MHQNRITGSEIWHPEILDYRSSNDADRIRYLQCRSDIIIYDQIEKQIVDYIRSLDPTRKLSFEEAANEIPSITEQIPLQEYGKWVFYPWSRRLVHLLPPNAFVALRTNRNRYKITPEEQEVLARKRIGIVGLSVGHSIAMGLGLERCFGELRLADFDTIDLSNLNRINTPVHNIGVNKAIVVARELFEIDPYLNISCYTKGIKTENIDEFLCGDGQLDLLIDECDSIDIKFSLRYAARKQRIPVLMDTSDNGLIDVERYDLEPNRKLFHGLVEEVSPEKMRLLSNREKVPYALGILGIDGVSDRMQLSLLEIESTVSTWPQLGSAILLGGGAATDTTRRILLGQFINSGRYYIDLEKIIRSGSMPESAHSGKEEQDFQWFIKKQVQSLPPVSSTAVTMPSMQMLRNLVSVATLAPSGGNSQPWLWVSTNHALHLFLDPRTKATFIDFWNLGSTLALGAAAESFILAAGQSGLGVSIEGFGTSLFPVARFTFPRIEPNVNNCSLAEGLRHRSTNRSNLPSDPLPQDLRDRIDRILAPFSGVNCKIVTNPQVITAIGRIAGEADRLRILNQAAHREMMEELRWDSEEAERTRDGIEVAHLGLDDIDLCGLQVIRNPMIAAEINKRGLGKNLIEGAQSAFNNSGGVGLLFVRKPTCPDFFIAGRALMHVWLYLEKCGFGVHPWTASIYFIMRFVQERGLGFSPSEQRLLSMLREEFSRCFGLDGSQGLAIMFRITTSPKPIGRSKRKPMEDILITH
ncbi:MAG: Rv1355c family protein [Moorea sp. SIO3C2]|nr:Rv1355c family protein [Moorena sp. SIO3C2]